MNAHKKNTNDKNLSVIVLGASGDLAKNKIYPALFALFCEKLLPEQFTIAGFARSAHTHESFRQTLAAQLTCRYVPESACAEKTKKFLSQCFYFSGDYGSADSFLDFYTELRKFEKGLETNRLFYMAVPPSVFSPAAHAIGNAGIMTCSAEEPWSRVVVEKPFGHDRASSDELIADLSLIFTEAQTFRIDHYLGKEAIQNLMALRFANIVFEPIWNNVHIERVTITWKEQDGVGERGSYFDQYGIIRDVIQNHLLQMAALIAMEPPEELAPECVRHEKIKVLESIPPLTLNDIIIAQYSAHETNNRKSYREEKSIPDNSLTPTYAAALMRINNQRWNGVPFLIRAGKAMDDKLTEIRLLFKKSEKNIFCRLGECPDANELIIRVQPDESINMKITNKTPGLGMKLQNTTLNLDYSSAFREIIPDAYESLLLDVMQGDRSLFISKGELAAAWDIFTPVLHEMEAKKIKPLSYQRGSDDTELLRFKAIG